MRRLVVALMCGISSSAYAAEIDIQIDNFSSDGNIASAVMKITNNTGRALRSIFIDCTFLDSNKKAIDIGKAMVSGIDAGGYAYEKASIVATGREKLVTCMVDSYRGEN